MTQSTNTHSESSTYFTELARISVEECSELLIDGTILYALSNELLSTFDVSDPASPKSLASLPLKQQPSSMAIYGSHLYIAHYRSGVIIVDVSNPSTLVPVDAIPCFDGNISTIRRVGDRIVYSCEEHGITLVDPRDEKARIVARLPMPDARRFAVDGNRIVVPCGKKGIAFVEVSGDSLTEVTRLYRDGSHRCSQVEIAGEQIICVEDSNTLILARSAPHQELWYGESGLRFSGRIDLHMIAGAPICLLHGRVLLYGGELPRQCLFTQHRVEEQDERYIEVPWHVDEAVQAEYDDVTSHYPEDKRPHVRRMESPDAYEKIIEIICRNKRGEEEDIEVEWNTFDAGAVASSGDFLVVREDDEYLTFLQINPSFRTLVSERLKK